MPLDFSDAQPLSRCQPDALMHQVRSASRKIPGIRHRMARYALCEACLVAYPAIRPASETLSARVKASTNLNCCSVSGRPCTGITGAPSLCCGEAIWTAALARRYSTTFVLSSTSCAILSGPTTVLRPSGEYILMRFFPQMLSRNPSRSSSVTSSTALFMYFLSKRQNCGRTSKVPKRLGRQLVRVLLSPLMLLLT